MIKKILVLVAMAGMVLIHPSTFAQKGTTKPRTNRGTFSDSQSTPVLKPAPTKVNIYDVLRYEYITASMYMEPHSSFEISVVNCRDEGDEYVQIEVHAAVVSGQAPSPKLLQKSDLTKVAPQNIFVFKHVRRGDGTDGNPQNHWIKIKTSSEYLIPKVIRRNKPDSSHPLRIEVSYLPGDFAVFTRYPFKRIR